MIRAAFPFLMVISMASVTSRIAHIEQPSYGYLNPSLFKKIVIDDGIMLNKHENIAASLIGL